jgi:hypothetical protein
MVIFNSNINSSISSISYKGRELSTSAIDICRLATNIFVFSLSLYPQALADSTVVYFGTSGKNSKGIYKAKFDTSSGKLSGAELAVEINNPGF